MPPAQAQPNPILSFLPLILMFVVFYVLLMRPQQKRQKEHAEMVKNLKRGDKVVTQGRHKSLAGRQRLVATYSAADSPRFLAESCPVTTGAINGAPLRYLQHSRKSLVPKVRRGV